MKARVHIMLKNGVLDPQGEAVRHALGSLGFGWLAYDAICKSRFGEDITKLMIGLYLILVAMAWDYTQVFSGRAALLHLGAFTATIMSANVFFIIIPNQKIVVAALKAGPVPAPKYGVIAKQRSTHNNYLTLPVLFLMLSNHYPLAFASEYNWAIAGLVFLMGVTIRHYFNTIHARGPEPRWTWAATAVIFIASIVVPVSKFMIIAWLALSIQRGWSLSEHRRHFAHEAVELIGRWSMIDVFVVAALAALIQVGALMSILPGVGVNAFAMSVIFTMLSAMSFDTRLIWDGKPPGEEPQHGGD